MPSEERLWAPRLPDPPVASSPAVWPIACLGIAFDLAFNGQRPGLSILLFVCGLAAGLATVVRGAGRRALLVIAVVFAIFPVVRASEGLIVLDVLAVTGLFGVAVAWGGSLLEASVLRAVAVAVDLLWGAARAPRFVLAPLTPLRRRLRMRRARPLLRTLAIAGPILVIFATLLGNADRVFAEVITPSFPQLNLGNTFAHVALILTGTFAVATLWWTAAGENGVNVPGAGESVPRLGSAEWGTLLAGIDTLFAIFVVVQFRFLFGGESRVLVTEDLTYAEYARSGFFQLLAVSALTAVVILGAWDLGRREGTRQVRIFRGLVLVMVGLSFVILASAMMRLALYEGTFGFTVARLLAYVAIAWIGVVLAALAVAIWADRRDRIVFVVAATALVALFVFNALNPERFVAERNAARYRAIGKIDAAYLGSLGDDAVPVVVELLPSLNDEDAARVRTMLCERGASSAPDPSWRSWNAARAAARGVLARLDCR